MVSSSVSTRYDCCPTRIGKHSSQDLCGGICGHFGSRAVSIQLSIVAVQSTCLKASFRFSPSVCSSTCLLYVSVHPTTVVHNICGNRTAQLLMKRRRIDWALIHSPMAEAREFRCRAETVDDLGNRSLLCDHTAICVEDSTTCLSRQRAWRNSGLAHKTSRPLFDSEPATRRACVLK